MHKVFVSYSSADRELAARLIGDLQLAGVDVWDPAQAILPGDNWALKIGEALAKSEVMVPLVTHNTKDSRQVSDDVSFALTAGNYRGRVLPVFVDMSTNEATVNVPWVLNRLQHVKVQGTPPDFKDVVKQIQELAGAGHATSQ